MPIDIKDIQPPLLGVNKRLALQHQAPYSCADALNIWPRDPIGGRMRVGSRPGLSKVFPTDVSGPCHLLANVRVVEVGPETYADPLHGSDMALSWSQASWRPDLPIYTGSVSFVGYVYCLDRFVPADGGGFLPTDVGVVLDRLSLDVSQDATVSIQCLTNASHETLADQRQIAPVTMHSVFARMDNANPNVVVAGVEARISQLSSNGAGSVRRVELFKDGVVLAEAIASGDQAVKLSLKVDSSDNAFVYLDGDAVISSIAVGTAAGQRYGYGISGSSSVPYRGSSFRRRADNFRVDYTSDVASTNRNIVVAAGGTNASLTHSGEVDLQYEDTPNVFAVPTEQGVGTQQAITNASARQLQAAELLGRLYIVGEDQTAVENPADATKDAGSPIWQFDPTGTGSLVTLNTSNDASFPYVGGTVPGNCATIAAWRQRLCVVSRDDMQNVLMSQSAVPGNWVYRTVPPGSPYRLNLTGSDTSKLGEPVNCLIPHSDDYLLIGSLNSLHVLRGDPTVGGQIDRLSSVIGIAAPQAWARGPNGETVFITSDGLYSIPAGVLAYPQSISRERLPNELRDIDVNNFRILMAYDIRNRGVFIGLTPVLGGGGTYFWFDWENRGFWPMRFNESHEPTSLVYRNADSPLDQRLLFGCRDGNIRAMEESSFTDDGTPFETDLLLGPIALGGGGYFDGMLLEVVGQTGTGSGDVACEVKVGNSIEAARNATPRSPFTLRAGKNLTHRPRLRGNASFIRLSTAGGSPWAYENLTIARERLGKQRL